MTGAGFTPGGVQILQCTSDLNRCRILTNTTSGAGGGFSAPVQVMTIFTPDPTGVPNEDLTPIDCRIYPYCVVWAIETTAANKNNYDDIHFAGELPPPITSTNPPTPGPGQSASTCKGQQATIVGTAANDEIIGTGGPDVIAALGGADEVSGLGAEDLICGGPGKDKLLGGPGKDRLYGDGGADKLKGGGGNDTCRGGKGRDSLSSC